MSDLNKKMINLFQGNFGFADFIRGTSYLISLMDGICDVEWHVETPLRRLLKYPGHFEHPILKFDFEQQCKELVREERQEFLLEHLKEDSNLFIQCNYTEEVDGVFPEMIKSLFLLNEEYSELFENFFQEITNGQKYHIIHCRLGDTFLWEGTGKTIYYEKYRHAIENLIISDSLTLLLTDDMPFRDYITKVYSGLKVTTQQPVHTSSRENLSLLAFTFYEMLLMTRAVHIDCLTSLPWGRSGFSRVPAKVFQVPYSQKKII